MGNVLGLPIFEMPAEVRIVDISQSSWTVSSFFPKGIDLKVKMTNGTGCQLVQSGKTLVPDSNGVYTIYFDAGCLAVVVATSQEEPMIIKGDVNGDNKVDSYQNLKILAFII